MIHQRITEVVPASTDVAFDVIHDYRRRLEWDTLLRRAYVAGDGPACAGAVAVCSGRWAVGGLTLETVYVSFQRGVVAAVKMTNRPPFFDTWAASIKHDAVDGTAADSGSSASSVTYTVTFSARPRWLAFLLEPILGVIFRWETRRRLRALARYLATNATRAPPASSTTST